MASFGPRRRSRPFAVLDAAGLRLRGQKGLRPCRRPKSTTPAGSRVVVMAATSFGPRGPFRPFAVLEAAGLRLRGQKGLRPCRRPKSTTPAGSRVVVMAMASFGPRGPFRPFAVLEAAGLRLRGQRGLRPCWRTESLERISKLRSGFLTRRGTAKKRSIHEVCEHFEPAHNAVRGT